MLQRSKRIISIISLIVVFCAAMTVSIMAASPLREWVGDALVNLPGDAGKDTTNKIRTMRQGENTANHPIWGAETDPIVTGGKTYTVVIEAKIAEDDDSTPDDTVVFDIDPKIRVVNASGEIINEPQEQPTPVTAKEMRDAKKDASGYSKYYHTITPEAYGNGERIKIENRVRYYGNTEETNENRIGVDVKSITLYEGEIKPDDDGGDPEPEPNQQTSDSMDKVIIALFGMIFSAGVSIGLLKKAKQ